METVRHPNGSMVMRSEFWDEALGTLAGIGPGPLHCRNVLHVGNRRTSFRRLRSSLIGLIRWFSASESQTILDLGSQASSGLGTLLMFP